MAADDTGTWILPRDRLVICRNADFLVAAPNLNLSPEEKRTYGQLFRQADSDSVGVVVGEIAVKFFHKTGLDSRILGEVCLRSPRFAARPTFR